MSAQYTRALVTEVHGETGLFLTLGPSHLSPPHRTQRRTFLGLSSQESLVLVQKRMHTNSISFPCLFKQMTELYTHVPGRF